MFGLFKRDPARKLRAEYEAKLKEARDAQRGGDIELFAKLTAQAEALGQAMEQAKADHGS